MGTNFYLIGIPEGEDDSDPRWHIGKRSAAGMYCFDCGVTLCEQGEEFIHHCHYRVSANDPKTPLAIDYTFTHTPRCDWLDVTWLENCPVCKTKFEKEDLKDSSAGLELGFNKKVTKKTGVHTCSSFSWAMTKEDVISRVEELMGLEVLEEGSKSVAVVDEYGIEFTLLDFFDMIDCCPVQYLGSIGVHFS